MELYPNIFHEAGLAALRKTLDKRDKKIIPAENVVNMEIRSLSSIKTSLNLTLKLTMLI